MISSLPKKIKLSNIPNTMVIIYLLLFIACFASLNSELSTGKPLLVHYFNLNYPIFMRASAIFEIISLLGFSNVLIGLVYANLDKTMLGLTYSEIVLSSFPLYNLFTVLHILITVVCIAISASGMDESSVICFIAVICGFFYQWTVIVNVVLDSKKCEIIAFNVWEQKLKNDKLYKDSLNDLQHIVESFCYNNKHYQAHLKILCTALINVSSTEVEPKIAIQDISYIWNELLKSPSQAANSHVAEDIFNELQNRDEQDFDKENKRDCLCRIISGFIIQQINLTRENTNANINESFIRIYRRIALVVYNLSSADILFSTDIDEAFSPKRFIVECICANLFVLACVCMCLKTLNINNELYEIAPKEYHEDSDVLKYISEIIELLRIAPLFQREKIESAVIVAKKHLKLFTTRR